MVVICPNCSAQNRPLAKFCMKCVTSLSTVYVDRQEDALEATEYTATLRVPRTAEWAADSEAKRGKADFNEFAEHALPDGTLIEGFRIVRSIGEGGFGIVYLAWDAALERHVAIKEYMPTSLAVRADPSLEVSMRSDRNRSTFDAGLKSFVNEARLLARFDHPALVKVFRFWEANRTAYMAMPFYEGPTLKTTLAAAGNMVSEPHLRAWIDPLLDALEVLHREQCYHRDISPDNILLTTSGPVLLDFGAARRVISDMTQALTAVLKPGFAPIEQYGGELQQGPWTDLYALAGVVHYAITGRAPTASVVRVVSDTLRPLSVTHAGKYSDSFLRAIDAALAVRPEARPQDVAAFRLLLDADKSASVATVPATPERVAKVNAGGGAHVAADVVADVAADEAPLPDYPKTELLAAPAAAPTSIDRLNADGVPLSKPVVSSSTQARKLPPGRRYGVAVACLIMVGSTIFWWTKQDGAPRVTEPVPVASAAATPPAPPAVAPVIAAEKPAAQVVLPSATPTLASPMLTAPTSAVPTPVPVKTTPEPRTAMRVLPASAVERKKPTAAMASIDEPRVAARADAEPEPASARKIAARPQRCADIIQKSSLDTLTADEVAYLKKECR